MRLAACALLAARLGPQAAAVPVPDDWAAGVAGSNLLFAPTPAAATLLPSIENGFIGGDVGCGGGDGGSSGQLHIAGLYSGGSRTESRSGLPNPLAAEPANLTYAGSALDVSEGAFLERWALPDCGADAVLESRRFAHREHRSLLVWQLRALKATSQCSVAFRGCSKGPSGMSQLASGVYQVVSSAQAAPAATCVAGTSLTAFMGGHRWTQRSPLTSACHGWLPRWSPSPTTFRAAARWAWQRRRRSRGTSRSVPAASHSCTWRWCKHTHNPHHSLMPRVVSDREITLCFQPGDARAWRYECHRYEPRRSRARHAQSQR